MWLRKDVEYEGQIVGYSTIPWSPKNVAGKRDCYWVGLAENWTLSQIIRGAKFQIQVGWGPKFKKNCIVEVLSFPKSPD